METTSQGDSGYIQLGMPLEEFRHRLGYPWPGEEALIAGPHERSTDGRMRHSYIHTPTED